MQKLFSIFILVAMVISFVPKEAFCADDHQEAATHQHCSITCHSCFSAVIPVALGFPSTVEVLAAYSIQVVSYQSPISTRLKIPPIQIS